MHIYLTIISVYWFKHNAVLILKGEKRGFNRQMIIAYQLLHNFLFYEAKKEENDLLKAFQSPES